MSESTQAPQAIDRHQPLPGARRALIVLLAINLFNYIDRYVLVAVMPRIQDEFFPHGDPDVQAKMGSLATAFFVSYMLFAPVFGWLADRVSRWLLVGASVIAWSIATGASGFAETFALLWLTRIFVGIGEAAYGPAAPTIIADMYPVKRRGASLAWFYMAIPVGSALGYALGGAIEKYFGWRWAFYVAVVPGILLGLLSLRMKEVPRGQADAVTHKRSSGLKDYLVLLRTRSYLLNTLGMTAMTFAIGGISFWMPTYIYSYRHAGTLDDINATFGGIVVVAGIAATLTGGWLADKLRPHFPSSYFLVSAAGLFAGFPFVLLVLWTPFPAAWVFVFLAVFCLFFNTGPSNTILANVTHPSMRATAFALNIFVIHALGDAISPMLIGRIADRYDMNTAFIVMAGVTLLGGCFWLWGARYLQRDTELAPQRLPE